MLSSVLLVAFFNSNCSSGGGEDSEEPISCFSLLNLRMSYGSECPTDELLPFVAVKIVLSNSTAICSGTVVGKRHVISAAHCFLRQDRIGTSIYFNEKEYKIQDVSVHPQFDLNLNSQMAVNDIAILESQQRLDLPALKILTSRPLERGEPAYVFGYGSVTGEYSSKVEYLGLRGGVLHIDTVKEALIYTRAKSGDAIPCMGDSGAGLLVNIGGNKGALAISGVVSAGTKSDCQEKQRSIFTALNASSILSFMHRQIPDLQEE